MARGFESHLAQTLASLMVEYVAVNHRDEGSIPSQDVFPFQIALMVEYVAVNHRDEGSISSQNVFPFPIA